MNFDQATKEFDLSSFLFFSSIAGIEGNVGQADYATASSFLDEYAAYRNQLVSSRQRKGRTLSINWPLWQDDGVNMPEWVEKIILNATGMVAMSGQKRIRALYQAMASGHHQVMVKAGDTTRLKENHIAIPSAKQIVQSPSKKHLST